MKTLKKILMGLAVAVGITTAAQAYNNEWTSLCKDATTYGKTGLAAMHYAGAQRGIAAEVTIAESATSTAYTIFDYGNGDNRVQLLITSAGKYQLIVNNGMSGGTKFDVTSTTDVTAGRHVFATLVRRGVSGGGHVISVIVYLDGAELFKVGNGSTSFVTGPFRNMACGTSGSANTISVSLWSATESAGTNDTDPTKIANIVADANILYEPSKEYYATLDGYVDGWSGLYDKWNPEMPEEGFSATDTLIITNEANQSFNMDQDVTALKLKFVSSPDAPDLNLEKIGEEQIVAIGTYDFSEAESKMTVKYEMAASVVAGKDTVLEKANNPSLTIAAGKKLTVNGEENGCSLKASKVSNAGTLHFVGGTEDSPIALTGNADFGTVTLAEDTVVRNTVDNNRIHKVTGADVETSVYKLARNSGYGMTAGTQFRNLTFVVDTTGSTQCWIERADSFDATVNVRVDGGAYYMYGYSPTIGTLSGVGAVTGGNTLTITPTADAEYKGTSSAKFVIAEGEGVETLSGAYTGNLTVNAGGQVKLTGSAKPSKITNNGTVTFAYDEDTTNTLNKATIANNGTIYLESGVFIVPDNFGGVIESTGGTIITAYTVGINNMGKFKIPEGKTWDSILLVDGAGNPVEITSHDETYVYFDWQITGKNCWWDYEFEGNGNNDGTEGTGLNWDGGRPFSGNEYVQDETTGKKSLHIPSRPWRDVSKWPTTATFVMYGTMLKDANKYYVVFGSTTGGTKNTVFLATDDIDNSKVVLCRANGLGDNATVTKLCTMTVPNATSAKHLYAFVLKTVDSQSVIDIYLDGELLQEYPFGEVVSLGTGFQIASPHGGEVKGYARPANDDPALLDWLRVYDVELSKAALEKYAVEYPYVSPNGSYVRTVADGDVWTATDAWTIEGTEPAEYANAPKAGSTVKLAVNGETTLSVNLDADVSYEAIKISGDDLTVALAEGEQTGKVVSTGRVTADANVTFKYDAFTMAGAPITVKKDKTVTFDLSMVDMTQYFETKDYDLTGYVTLEEGAKLDFVAPTELHGRTVSATIDETTKHYIVTVTVPENDFNYADGVWTWGEEQVVDAETVSNNTALAINVKSDLEWNIDRASIAVEGGTFTVAKVTKRAAAVTVEPGATLDLNGNNAKEMALTLNGGKVTYGDETAPDEGDQIKVLTLTADSEIDTTVKGQIYAQSYNTATTIALDTYKLTKTGTKVLQVVNTDITGAGTIYVKEGEFYGSEDTHAPEATFQIGDGATLHNRAGKTMTLAKIVGTDDEALIPATLNNEGTISGFELSGKLAIANSGTFGTITNAAGAVVYLYEKRGITFAGAGTVSVTLTDAEVAAGAPITLFNLADEATTKVAFVGYNGKDITDLCTIEDGTITALPPFEAKIGTRYYLTLAEAFDVGVDEKTITLVKDVSLTEAIPSIVGTVTFDMAGYTVSSSVIQPFTVGTDGFLTITGNGTIKGPTNGEAFDGKCVVCVDGGTLNYANGTLTATGSDDSGMYGVYVLNGGKAAFGVANQGGPTITAWFAAIGANNTTPGTGVSIIVNGGTYTQQANGADQWWHYFCAAIYAPAAGTYEIGGGTFTGALYCLASPYANVEQTIAFNAGTFNQPLYVAEGQGAGTGTRTITKAAEVEIVPPEGYTWQDDKTLVKVTTKVPTVSVDEYEGEMPEGLDTAYTYSLTDKGMGYDDWNVDYFVSFDKDIAADTVTLKGQYGAYDWLGSTLPATTAGTEIQLVPFFTTKGVTVAEMAAMGTFNCGAGDTGANAGTKITVTLKMFKEGEETITLDTQTYTFESKGPDPVAPGQEIEVPTGADPETFRQQVEDSKATLLKAPEDVLSGEGLAAYQALFTATLDGLNVKFELNEAGTNAVVEATTAAKTDALAVALSEGSEFTIAEPIPGFYYSLKQGSDVQNLGFNEATDQNKLAGKDTISFMLIKEEGASFYQTIITPTPTKVEE